MSTLEAKENAWSLDIMRTMGEVPRFKFDERDPSEDVSAQTLAYSAIAHAHKVKETIERRKLGKNFIRRVRALTGFPGSGKSYWFDREVEAMRRWLIIHDADPDQIGRVTWEDSEQRLIKKGEIITPPHNPFSDEELGKVNKDFEDALAQSIKDYPVIEVEVPMLPSAFLDNNQVGRKLGLGPMRKLVRAEPPFNDLPGYDVSIVTFIGNKVLREFSACLRDGFHNSKSALEAWNIARIFQQTYDVPPKPWQDLTDLQRCQWNNLWSNRLRHEGASPAQMRKIDTDFKEVINILSGHGQLRHLYSQMTLEQAEAELARYALSNESNLGLNPIQYLIAVSAMSREQIIRYNTPELNEYLKNSGPGRRLFFNHIPEASD